MRRLNGGDIQFIYAERPWRQLHTLKVLVIDPTVDGAHWTPEATIAELRARLPELAPLRWVLRKVPGRVFHPVWLDAGEIDLDQHVRVVQAPEPGDDAALAEVASEVTSTPLDRSRPLWELVICEGLSGGRAALIWKLHHAIADGTASLNLIETLCDPSPASPAHAERPALPADAEPSVLQLVVDAARDLGRLLVRLPSMVAKVARAAVVGTVSKRRTGHRPAFAFTTAQTRFNRPLTPNRSWTFVEVELDHVREVKEALGGTVNDVFLSLCSTALREHLLERNELPAKPIGAAVPVTIRAEVTDERWGNFPSNLFVTLATHVEDPVERYQAVASSQAAAKAWHDEREHGLMFDWMEAYPAWVAYTRLLPFIVQKVIRRPSFGLIASNMRGPTHALHHCGAPVVALHSMGPLFQELGLNITAWSYAGRLSLGLHACREHAPDLDELARRIPTALEELRKAAVA